MVFEAYSLDVWRVKGKSFPSSHVNMLSVKHLYASGLDPLWRGHGVFQAQGDVQRRLMHMSGGHVVHVASFMHVSNYHVWNVCLLPF